MSREQKRSLLLIAAAAVLLIGLHFVPVTGWGKLALYLIPYLLVGGETLVDACKGIYNRQPFDENLLMAVATIGAMVLGDYPEAVSVMLFYQIGELFESYAVGRSRKNIGDLMDIRPDFAYVETADGIVRVKPEEVAVGDTIVVKPGERVPLDGDGADRHVGTEYERADRRERPRGRRGGQRRRERQREPVGCAAPARGEGVCRVHGRAHS